MKFEFDKPFNIPTVHILTDNFEADVYEMYEMPSSMVTDMMAAEGPAQMEIMARLFRMAIVNPDLAEYMDLLSFNELSSAMYQWYRKSNIRITTPEIETKTKKRTLQDILQHAEMVESMMYDEDEELEHELPEDEEFDR